ncbi:MAG: hypothetical protein D6805_05635 [Planctomycetota bacterium]|nr:MAG: hypothetical protein D6805_05635 [Planctomycetota bacterium]
MVPFFREAFRSNEFILKIGSKDIPVLKVSGLSSGSIETTLEQFDPKYRKVYKVAGGIMKFEPLTIERYVTSVDEEGTKEIMEWFFEDVRLDPKEGVAARGTSKYRKSGAIIKKNFGTTVAKWVFWGAWIKSIKYDDLEAGSENLFKQTIVLEHEGIERHPIE